MNPRGDAPAVAVGKGGAGAGARVVIGTAGHVDHGKTALVRALTGQDTDRLPEEKRRGISIDLGFASCTLPGGTGVSFIDVPGHERFIRNMVAGVAGMDMVLLAVAADEGVMPQTREHLDILQLLGVRHGLVVITKKDLVEPEWLDLVREEVRAAVSGTFLEGAPVIAVSSVTGEGLAELLEAIESLLPSLGRRPAEGSARLPVDRVFTVAGFGTVVTGTLLSGSIAVDDRVELLPLRRTVRVRQVQVHGSRVERAFAGQRVALNLVGVEKGEVSRGDVLAAPGSVEPVQTFAAKVTMLASAPHPLKAGDRFHLHTGTAEVIARVIPLGSEEVPPGGEGYVQVVVEGEVVASRGDRCLIRSYSPAVTVGGGVVLAPGRRFRRRDEQALEELRALESGDPSAVVLACLRLGVRHRGASPVGRSVSRSGGSSAWRRDGSPASRPRGGPLARPELLKCTGLSDVELAVVLGRLEASGKVVMLQNGEWCLTREDWDWFRQRVGAELDSFYQSHPLRAGMPREALRAAVWPGVDQRVMADALGLLAAQGVVELRHELVVKAGRVMTLTPDQQALREAIEKAYLEAGASPPAAPETQEARDVFQLLVDEGVLVEVTEGLFFHRSFLEEAATRLRQHLESHGSIAMSEFRDLLGTTRKFAVPLAEHFDRVRLTRRSGDRRVLY